MGLITGLLTLPLAPVRGVGWIAEQIAEQAEFELYDESRIMQELGELDAMHERGEISEDQFDQRVEETLMRLELSRQMQVEKGIQSG